MMIALQRAQDGPPAGAARRQSILADAVTRDVIPKLVERLEAAAAREAPVVTDGQVADLAALAWHDDGPAVTAYVDAMRRQGFPAQTLYLDLLAPAAALLGQFWVDDVCNFLDVTIGMVHLQSALRALGPALFEGRSLAAPVGARVMLLPLPGEQHTFGLQMLTDFFRHAGFDTWTGTLPTTVALRDTVAAEWVDIIGFSIGCTDALDRAAREIAAVRRASKNPAIVVMVGGPPLVADPACAAAIGADGTARNGLDAVSVAESLLRSRRSS